MTADRQKPDRNQIEFIQARFTVLIVGAVRHEDARFCGKKKPWETILESGPTYLLERLTRWNLCGIRYFIVSSVPAAHTYANAAMNRYKATFLGVRNSVT